MKIPIVWVFFSLGLFGPHGSLLSAPSVNVNIHVVSIDGSPVQGADVGVASYRTSDGAFPAQARGRTDGNGRFSAEICSYGEIVVLARKQGYYEGGRPLVRLGSPDAKQKAVKSGRWTPWEQTVEVELKPIRHPVPMYAKQIRGKLPATGVALGYDLQMGDWVPPYGHGEHVDLELSADVQIKNKLNYVGTLTLRFPGKDNGIEPYTAKDELTDSRMVMPYEAPEGGYVTELSIRKGRKTDDKPYARAEEIGANKNLGHFFIRARSVVREDGTLAQAWYGKIYGPIVFDPRNGGYVEIRYFLNPDTTRNIEFDSGRNLLNNLPRNERPSGP